MSNTFGEMSWNDDVNFGGGEKKKKDEFLRLDDGSNVVRLLTQPHQYTTHKGIKKAGEKGYGRKVSCSAIHGSCPLCDLGHKVSSRWFLGVLDRKSGAYRILDISYQVFSQIRKLARKVDVWGDPSKYDIDIIVDRNGKPADYYSVQPIPHKPLTPAEQAIRDGADLDALKAKIQPLSAEVVQKIIDKMLAGGGTLEPPKETDKEKEVKAAAKNGKGKTVASVDMTDEQAVDEIFPAYDGNSETV